jgi:hypothetical protein
MVNWISIFKHLLPRARAWKITIDKQLRKFFDGLTVLGSDSKEFIDDVYLDIEPQSTRELAEWEKQFALPTTGLTEQERRDRVDGTWKALGGQDPRYIQDTLQAAGFDVYVHEWWVPIAGRPNGGSVNGDVTPVARNPFDYLDDGTGGTSLMMLDGAADAQDGDTAVGQDGATATPVGYPLVNKIVEIAAVTMGDGAATMQDGDSQAQDGGTLWTFPRKQYTMPADPDTYPYYLYIGGETFPEQAHVPVSRMDEFEDLCLKICPAEQWLGILVNYS